MSADAKHSADRPDLNQMLRDAAQEREQILAQLATADAAKAAVEAARWVVVKQAPSGGEVVETPVSGHRFERVAHWRAYRLTRSHPQTGTHYTVRRAVR